MKYIQYGLMLFLTSSCFQVNCEKLAESSKEKYCDIVVTKHKLGARYLELHGIDPITKQKILFSDVDSWYSYFQDKISEGDTVVKRKSELVFYIHKKDTVLIFPFMCDGSIYE